MLTSDPLVTTPLNELGPFVQEYFANINGNDELKLAREFKRLSELDVENNSLIGEAEEVIQCQQNLLHPEISFLVVDAQHFGAFFLVLAQHIGVLIFLLLF